MSIWSTLSGIGDLVGTGLNVYGFFAGQNAADEAADKADAMYGQTQKLTAQQAKLADEMLRQSKEQWAFWKQYYAPVQKEIASDYSQYYLPYHRDVTERYRNEFLPFESRFMEESEKGIQPQYETVMGRASTDVAQAFDQQRAQADRTMARYGIDPSSGRFAGIERGMDIAESAADAGARTTAREAERRRVEDTNWQRKAQAYGLKKGVGYTPSMYNPTGTGAGLMGQASGTLGNAAGQFQQLGNTATSLGGQAAYGAGGFLSNLANTNWGNTFSNIGNMFSGGSNSSGGSGFSYGNPYYNSNLGYGSGQYFGGFMEEGGPVSEGTPYVVGEAGPEMFVPEQNGIIVPNPKTMAMKEQRRGLAPQPKPAVDDSMDLLKPDQARNAVTQFIDQLLSSVAQRQQGMVPA